VTATLGIHSNAQATIIHFLCSHFGKAQFRFKEKMGILSSRTILCYDSTGLPPPYDNGYIGQLPIFLWWLYLTMKRIVYDKLIQYG
jgi:hypothetical protein